MGRAGSSRDCVTAGFHVRKIDPDVHFQIHTAIDPVIACFCEFTKRRRVRCGACGDNR